MDIRIIRSFAARLALGLAALTAVAGAAQAQTFTPVPVTGFTQDVVVESLPGAASTTTDMDGAQHTLYSRDLPGTTVGLPVNRIIQSATYQFQLAPYTGSNTLAITGLGAGALTLATPAPYQKLAVMAHSTNGASTATFDVTFADASTYTVTGVSVGDWFFQTSPFGGWGRFNLNTDFADNNAINPRFYVYELTIPLGQQSKNVVSVTTTQTSNAPGTIFVYGVAGVAYVVPVPTLSEWTMILLGLLLAAGAALHLQRRRAAL